MSTSIENKNEAPPLAEAIAAHRFAAGLKPEHLAKLKDAAMFRNFEKGEAIFTEGEPANRFYLLCSGKIALEAKREDQTHGLVQYLGGNDVLGWSWLFPPYYWHFSARAVEPSNSIFFYGTRLREQCEEDPEFGYQLMKRMAAIVINRLQITRVQVLQLQRKTGEAAV